MLLPNGIYFQAQKYFKNKTSSFLQARKTVSVFIKSALCELATDECTGTGLPDGIFSDKKSQFGYILEALE
jgi:hypothetical protein